jgi:hypothetical protein
MDYRSRTSCVQVPGLYEVVYLTFCSVSLGAAASIMMSGFDGWLAGEAVGL